MAIFASGLILYFIVTSNEIGSFNILVSDEFHVGMIMMAMLIFILANIDNISASKLRNNKKINIAGALLVAISLISWIYHTGFNSPLKYAINIIFFLVLINLLSEKKLKIYGEIFVNITSVLAVMGVLQTILISFEGVDQLRNSTFGVIEKNDSKFWGATDYMVPYGLGLVRLENSIDLLFFSHIRLIGFSSEPKYYSLIIISALGVLFYTKKRLNIYSMLKMLLLIFALMLSMAFTAFLVVVLSVFFYLINNIQIHEKIKVAMLLAVPYIIPNLKYFEELIPLLGAYSSERWDSFNYSVADVDNFNILNFSLLGVGELMAEGFGSTASLYISQMGLVWGVVENIFMFIIVGICYKKLKYVSKLQTFGFILIIMAIQVYNFIFLSQAITPLMIFVLAVLISNNSFTTGVKKIFFK